MKKTRSRADVTFMSLFCPFYHQKVDKIKGKTKYNSIESYGLRHVMTKQLKHRKHQYSSGKKTLYLRLRDFLCSRKILQKDIKFQGRMATQRF